MTRVAVARTVSIVGHPVVLISIAALIAASARAGRWSHVDASIGAERKSLNVFLAVLCLASAVVLWISMHRLHISVALALSGAIMVTALLMARWVKVSLYSAFAAFATALVWPITLAVIAGVLVTAAVVWSRLALRRHVAAGGAYDVWIA
ncbi:MAG TPA: hypothetical protein VE046_03660 [Steroidobacteraceae bacterium]|nr:hypothetical protein [Steroidobacteraceae bacterium]